MTWCSRCEVVDDRKLYARLSPRTALCFDCWDGAGRPPPRQATEEERHEAEVAIQKTMQKRGGKDRYMVRAGKA